MLTRRYWQSLFSVVSLVALLCQGTSVLAGTTGGLNGQVVDAATKKPIAGAKVAVASPSQIASTTTDANGNFNFIALIPDTYTVSIELKNYNSQVLPGITIAADQPRTLSIPLSGLRNLVTVRAQGGGLVRAGTTADVYNVGVAQAAALAGANGAGSLNTAYSAISTIPGTQVLQGATGSNGIAPNVYIRGGDYNQVGFEVDGVPINRSFDNYPSGPAASLGQQEVQVYTGAAPANAEGQGLAGFINQVIKVGTYPGSVSGDLGVGTPTFYHKAAIEVGGASPNRNFSYFVGADGYDQEFRYGDQFNGASLNNQYGAPLAPCVEQYASPGNPLIVAPDPSCFAGGTHAYGVDVNGHQNVFSPGSGANSYVLGPYNLFSLASLRVRDDVVNIHQSFPHKDGTKDDIQFLAYENYVSQQSYDSTADQGGSAYLDAIGLGTPTFPGGYAYSGAEGVPLPSDAAFLSHQYFYPKLQSSLSPFGGPINTDLRDSTANDQGILKLQFTKSLGQNALFKLYGYTYYSDWLMTGPQTYYADYGGDATTDYELSGHTRGLSGTLSDQINSQNLLQLQASYTTSHALRDNNNQGAIGSSGVLALLVDSSNPTDGLCYTAAGVAVNCALSTKSGGPAQFTVAQAYAARSGGFTIPTATGTCGGGPCEYFVVGNGENATFNQVIPKFTSGSLTDQFKPTNKLSIDLGLRFDDFQFEGSDTTGTAARLLYLNSANINYCVSDTTHGSVSKSAIGIANTAPCSSVTGYTTLDLTNPSGQVTQTYPVFQPRIGFTYSVDPSTVLRASYGRYAQAPNSAYEQYNYQQQNSASSLLGFLPLGFTSPNHPVRPQTSNNFDFSVEKSFPHALSFKLTPFLRNTQDQIQNFYLDQKTGFVSGLNVGRQRSQGVEFELDKGNFANQGISAKLAFTYTNSYIKYDKLASGASIIDPINQAIEAYNAYTSACAPGGKAAGTKACGTTSSGAVAAPCYTVAGAAVTTAAACTAANIANPYFNENVQGLLDNDGKYATYSTFPGGIGSSATAYGAPYVASLVLQDRIKNFTITPSISFAAGSRYGSPESTYGVAPDTCTSVYGLNPTGSTVGDPRYPAGSQGGSGFDAGTCGTLLGGIPDRYTKVFDGIGGLVAPSNLSLSSQFAYEFTKKFSLVATATNLLNTCFGGTKTGFTVAGACGYGVQADGTAGDIGNSYNPGANIQAPLARPYAPSFEGYPFNLYLTAKFKL